MEKSIYGSELIACQDVIEEILGVRELVRSLGYKVVKLSCIFYHNKSVVVVAYKTNIMIKKRSMALSFYMTMEAIVAGAVEL